MDTSGDDPVKMLRDISEGQGFDDVLVMAPVAQVISQADQILAENGCMNFFSGPRDTHLTAPINFFNIHYKSTHIIGTKGGTGKDLKEVADLMARGLLDPSCMITHIGGMNAVADTVLNLPEIPGGKKLIYNQMELPLTALEDLETQDDIRLRELGEIVKRNSGIWNVECEDYIRSHFCV